MASHCLRAADMDTTNVAILGLGAVGSGVAELLLAHGDRIARQAGRRLNLARVVVRDLDKPRAFDVPRELLTTDVESVLRDEKIEIVAELMGGVEPAGETVLRLLDAGKHVVTANKALLAEKGPLLFDRARKLGRSIAFEAAVAGGVPIIANIAQCLQANQIQSIEAILNGTSNYILTQMDRLGADYQETLAEAQRLGYAEADPTMDVDGADAAQKLAILAHLAFGADVSWRDIPRVGIDRIGREDIKSAGELGYTLRLLASARLLAASGDGATGDDVDELELHVRPTLVKRGSTMADVNDADNAIEVVGDAVGRVFFQGAGAGRLPTASAVVSDLIDTAVGRAAITLRATQPWSARPPRATPRDFAESLGRYYLRFRVVDHPGVLAEIAGLLGDFGVSIAAVIQRDEARGADRDVPLVIMTHVCREGDVAAAMKKIDQLPCLQAPGVRMTVRNGRREER